MAALHRNAVSTLALAALLSAPLPAQNSPGPSAASKVSHLQQGIRFARQQKWRDAEREFRIAHFDDPSSVEAEVHHAEALVQIGQPFDADLELQSFLQDHPDSARAHEFYAVVTLTTSDDFLLAQSELEKCVKLDPNNGAAWQSLGDIYLDHTTPQDAVGAYKKALNLLPSNPLVLASLANAYAQTGDNAQAEKTFATAIRLSEAVPYSPQAIRNKGAIQYLWGRYLLSQGRAKESLAASIIAVQSNPRSVVALYSRSRAYLALGEYKQAEADALRATELDPRDKQGPLLLIDIYRKEHDLEKLQKYADLAQKLVDQQQEKETFVRDVRSLLNVAEAAFKHGRYSDAIPPYEELIKKTPTFYEAYFGLGVSYSQTGRLPDAETALRKYLSFQPVSGDGHAVLGILLLQMERGPEAVPELKQALQIDPSLDEARKALATEFMRESKLDESVRTLRGARNSTDPQLIAMLGIALLQKGDMAGAKGELSRALALQPDNPDALKLKQEILSKADASKQN